MFKLNVCWYPSTWAPIPETECLPASSHLFPMSNTDPGTETGKHWIHRLRMKQRIFRQLLPASASRCLREIFELPLQDVDLERPTDTATRFYMFCIFN